MRTRKTRATHDRLTSAYRSRGMIIDSDFSGLSMGGMGTGNSTLDQYITGAGQFGTFPVVSAWCPKDASGSGAAGDTWWPSSRVLDIIGAGNANPITTYINNSLTTVTGPTGATVPALHLEVLGPSPQMGGSTQTQYYMDGMRKEPRFHHIAVFKIGENTLSGANSVGQGNYWRMVWEMKCFPDRRFRVELRYISGVPYWHVQMDVLTDASPILEQYTAIASQAVAEGWWTLDVWFDRWRGWWRAVMTPWGGTPLLIADYRGVQRLAGGASPDLSSQPWVAMMPLQVYGGPNAAKTDFVRWRMRHWQAPATNPTRRRLRMN